MSDFDYASVVVSIVLALGIADVHCLDIVAVT